MVVSVDVVVLNNGCIYAGECLRGVPEGNGIMKNLKGWILEGLFCDGVMTEGTIIDDVSSGIRKRFNSHVSDGDNDTYEDDEDDDTDGDDEDDDTDGDDEDDDTGGDVDRVLGKRTLEERLNDEMEAAYARGEVIDLT
jgi:hypothetical protein